ETAEELKDLDEQIGFKPFAGGLTALQDWSNKTFGTSFDTTEGHVEMDKRDKLIDRRNSIMHKLWAMEDDMHRLSHELTSFEQ
ncbi:hypothetical protein IKQ21_08265, partial [bacterium]|nr:hypothetical protein [bacterium]